MIRRATAEDAATLARLNVHVQSWHAAHYPKVFHARPDPAAVQAYFQDWLANPTSAICATSNQKIKSRNWENRIGDWRIRWHQYMYK